MKKGVAILFLALCCGICMVIGIFIGRTHRPNIHLLSVNHETELNYVTENVEDIKLDINAASKVQFMDLPGIGEELAERIVCFRTENGPFESTDELLNVEGIGKTKLLEIEEYIKVGG